MFKKLFTNFSREFHKSQYRFNIFSFSSTTRKIKKTLNQKKNNIPKIPEIPNDFINQQKDTEKQETLELYKKLIFDIENNKVDPSLEAMYMKQLLEYLDILIDEKTKLIGWIYLANYFYDKMDKLKDEDFLNCFIKLIKVKFKGTKSDFWEKTTNHLIEKKVVRKQLIPLFYSLTNIDLKLVNWDNIVNHLNKFPNLDFQDGYMIMMLLNKINYDMNHPIWENIIKTLKEVKYEKLELSSLISLIQLLIGKMEVEKYSNLLLHFKRYFIENVDKFEYIIKVKISTIIAHKKLFTDDEMSDLIISLFPKLHEISVQEKDQFIFTNLTYMKDNPKFVNLLKIKQIIYEKRNGKIEIREEYDKEFINNLIKSVEK